MLSTESTPLLSDVRDFSVFLVLVRKEIERYVVNCGPIVFFFRGEISGLPVCYSEEVKYLHEVFVDVLGDHEAENGCSVWIDSRGSSFDYIQ
ncbi:hypothetical protein ACJIZ3_006549 [Penstemon smallii]|uniref:Uncharacterized protein n=1 Tax=Penstemon smallii TaxID=265156 RepID=A0ABD3S814_9LAMI